MGFTEFIILFFVILALLIYFAISDGIRISKEKEKMHSFLSDLDDFTATKRYIGNNAQTGVAIDEKQKKIVLLNNYTSGVKTRMLSYHDILSSEIFVDGQTITSTARGSQLGGALLGGLLFGGVGAIIGGLSGKKKSLEKVTSVDLRITVNDTNNPLHDVNFMSVINEIDKTSLTYKDAIEDARYWHGLFAVIINSADQEDKIIENENITQEPTSINNINPTIIADEILKLSNLRDKGIITDEDFSRQKTKLLK